jgi:hypothetical protein
LKTDLCLFFLYFTWNVVLKFKCIYLAEDWDRFDEELPLSSSIINLVIECLSSRDTWITKAPVSLAVKILVGQRIETQFQVSWLSTFV